MRVKQLLISSLFVSMIVPNLAWARSEIDTRVSRLENIVANELDIKLLNQIEAMQQEIRELRGKLEEQQNSVQMLNQKQDKLYINLDSRINNLPSTNANTTAPSAAVTPAAPVSAPAVQTPIMQTTTQPTDTNTPMPPISAVEQQTGTSEKGLYDVANALVQQRKYAEAIIEYKDLLWQFPEGVYAPHAYYWLGELYSIQWQANRHDKNLLNQAKEAFTTITSRYQGQERAGDALLKLGLLEIDQDHLAIAKDLLQQVVSKYPNTARARIAENNIAKIDQSHFSAQPAQ